MDADTPIDGYYRIKQRRPGGQEVFVPVRYIYSGDFDDLECFIDGRRIDHHIALEQWPWACKNPVSREAYEAVLNGAGWPDIDATVAEAKVGSNNPPPGEELPPDAELRARINKLIEGIPAYVAWGGERLNDPAVLISSLQDGKVSSLIESDETVARAQTLRDALLGLKGEAEKKHKVEKATFLEEGRKVDRKWFDSRDLAEAAANALRRAMSAWETAKLRRAEAEAAVAQKAALDAAVATATKESAATGKPVVVVAPAPAPVAAAPSRIKGGSGKAAAVATVTVVKEVSDWPALFAHFRNREDVQAALVKNANAELRLGNPVPGVVTQSVRDVK